MTSKLDTACNGIAIVRIHCRNTFPEKGRKESIAIKIAKIIKTNSGFHFHLYRIALYSNIVVASMVSETAAP